MVRRKGLPLCSDLLSVSLIETTVGGGFPLVSHSYLPHSLLSLTSLPGNVSPRHKLGPFPAMLFAGFSPSYF